MTQKTMPEMELAWQTFEAYRTGAKIAPHGDDPIDYLLAHRDFIVEETRFYYARRMAAHLRATFENDGAFSQQDRDYIQLAESYMSDNKDKPAPEFQNFWREIFNEKEWRKRPFEEINAIAWTATGLLADDSAIWDSYYRHYTDDDEHKLDVVEACLGVSSAYDLVRFCTLIKDNLAMPHTFDVAPDYLDKLISLYLPTLRKSHGDAAIGYAFTDTIIACPDYNWNNVRDMARDYGIKLGGNRNAQRELDPSPEVA